MNYTIITSKKNMQRLENFSLCDAGTNFSNTTLFPCMARIPLSKESKLDFLLETKQPEMFAESEIKGDGSDWTNAELKVLGNISVAVPVTIYDDGKHQNPALHGTPFHGTLVYVPGPLLRAAGTITPVDYDIVKNGKVVPELYKELVREKLIPVFTYISEKANKQGVPAMVTIPGIGCGQFAGKHKAEVHTLLLATLLELLEDYKTKWTNILGIWYDPYSVGVDQSWVIGGKTLFASRPYLNSKQPRPQLFRPDEGISFFSLVAWDHVSFPGNDFFSLTRGTDDGVKSAATDSMWQITGVRGEYNRKENKYLPPSNYKDWEDVVKQHKIKLTAKDLYVV